MGVAQACCCTDVADPAIILLIVIVFPARPKSLGRSRPMFLLNDGFCKIQEWLKHKNNFLLLFLCFSLSSSLLSYVHFSFSVLILLLPDLLLLPPSSSCLHFLLLGLFLYLSSFLSSSSSLSSFSLFFFRFLFSLSSSSLPCFHF